MLKCNSEPKGLIRASQRLREAKVMLNMKNQGDLGGWQVGCEELTEHKVTARGGRHLCRASPAHLSWIRASQCCLCDGGFNAGPRWSLCLSGCSHHCVTPHLYEPGHGPEPWVWQRHSWMNDHCASFQLCLFTSLWPGHTGVVSLCTLPLRPFLVTKTTAV